MTHKTRYSLAGLMLVLMALTFVGVIPAMAAPPDNDTFAGATWVAVDFSETVDTTEATTDADDAQLLESLGWVGDASVWYAIEGTDLQVNVDVSASDYSAGVIVASGTQGNLSTITYASHGVSFFAEAGTTYYIFVFDYQGDGGGYGGNLSISISFMEVPPPPTLDFSVDPYGTFNSKTGTATLSGQYTCTSGRFIQMSVDARQVVGRVYIQGSGGFYDIGTCDGESHPWSAEIFPEGGVFKGGKALSVTFSYSCFSFDCAYGYVEQVVQLRGR